MEVLALVGFAVMIGLLVGFFMGISAFNQVRSLRVEVDRLKKQVAGILAGAVSPSAAREPQRSPSAQQPKPAAVQDNTHASESVVPSLEPRLPVGSEVSIEPSLVDGEVAKLETLELDIDWAESTKAEASAQIIADERAQLKSNNLEQKAQVQASANSSTSWDQLLQKWMVWLGGACVALAGIFLAKYSLEQGLLGPTARIAGGLITGVGLHVAAFWLRGKQGNHDSFAALAGGGSITLFAALLASLHFYQMFSPTTVFVCLAIVAVATLWMALLHGPVLAAIGMLGAYSVPALVSTGSGNVTAAMLYALVISASVLGLLRHVYRPWLWWGLIVGGLFWWAVSLTGHQADGWRGGYLALFAYGLLAFVSSNWLLNQRRKGDVWPFSEETQDLDNADPQFNHLPLSLLLVVLAQSISIWQEGWQGNWLGWSLLPGLLLWVAGFQARLTVLVWVAFLGQWLAIFARQLDEQAGRWTIELLAPELQASLFVYVGTTALLFSAFAVRNLRLGQAKNYWAALFSLAPVLSLLLSYCLGAQYSSEWQWALLAVCLGAIYLWLGTVAKHKAWHKETQVWLILAGHFAYSLAAAWVLEEASLTLALAVQIASIAWIIRRFEVPELGWLLKAVAVLVVVRLTLNPWLASYPVDQHWSLWTYGGATLICWLSTSLLKPYSSLSRWTEAAALHLFVLTVWSEARYWMNDGNAFSDHFDFAEAVLNSVLFSALALVYHVKSQVSKQLANWYQIYGRLQLGFACLNYGVIVIALLASEPWAWQSVGSTPIFNLALLALGGPVVMAWLVAKHYEPAFRPTALLTMAAAGFIFISFEIRHLWQGSLRLSGTIEAGEMYTYSVVWLACAVGALLGGSWRFGKQCYRGGMALLAVVILKIFFIDLSDLEGLWRVASFMGLGFALLGVAFLHQKIQKAALVD